MEFFASRINETTHLSSFKNCHHLRNYIMTCLCNMCVFLYNCVCMQGSTENQCYYCPVEILQLLREY